MFNDDIPASDLMVLEIPGMPNWARAIPAGRATSFAAQILVRHSADGGSGVLTQRPAWLCRINVPADTLESDAKTIEQRFRDFFNPAQESPKITV